MSITATSVNRVCPVCKESYPFQTQHICAQAGAQPPEEAPRAPADPLVGAVLGERYQITNFLSSGGMGVVYKGRHVVLDKPVAIKLLRESQDPVAQQRFLLEAKSACHIGHEHIVDITDFGVLEDGRPYLVMEFLQGQSLETLLAQKGAIPGNRVCRIGEQIARGLQAVHEKGILHRDLKPGNIFLLDRQKRDFVKILDFGIAKVMAGTRETLSEGKEVKQLVNMRQTTQGTVLGTPEYLSPEQAAGEAIDSRVDIYALGCILYEMVTGDVPFRGNGPMSTLMKHLTENVVPPRSRRPDLTIPDSLEKIVLKAMARDKNDRYATMEELANALQNEVEQTPTYQGDVSSPAMAIPGRSQSGAMVPLAYAPTTMADTVKRPPVTGLISARPNIVRIGIAAGLALVIAIGLIVGLSMRAQSRRQRELIQQQLEQQLANMPPPLPAATPDMAPPTVKALPEEQPGPRPGAHPKGPDSQVGKTKPGKTKNGKPKAGKPVTF